jgi:hypothetical protein
MNSLHTSSWDSIKELEGKKRKGDKIEPFRTRKKKKKSANQKKE